MEISHPFARDEVMNPEVCRLHECGYCRPRSQKEASCHIVDSARIFWVEIYNSKLLQSWCLDNSTWCLDLMKIRWTWRWRSAIWELGGKRSHHGTLLMWTRMKTCEDYRGMTHSTIDDTWQPVVFEEAQRRVGEWAFGYVCPFAANACTCTAPKDTLAPKLSFAFDAASYCSLPQELTFHPRWCSAPAFSKSKAIIGMFFQAWSFSKAGLTTQVAGQKIYPLPETRRFDFSNATRMAWLDPPGVTGPTTRTLLCAAVWRALATTLCQSGRSQRPAAAWVAVFWFFHAWCEMTWYSQRPCI